jgi:LemA protein
MGGFIMKGLFSLLLKLAGAFILSWILLLIIFAGCNLEVVGWVTVVCGIALSFITIFIIEYNNTVRLKASLPRFQADIAAAKEKGDHLLDRANGISEKYLSHESEIMLAFAKSNAQGRKIGDSGDFRYVVESFPELKADQSVLKLLEQIENAEGSLYNTKLQLNMSAEKYNAQIHSFPIVLLRKIAKFNDWEIKPPAIYEKEITDE